MALTRVTTGVIEDGAVTTEKVANLAISNNKIAAGAISADKLASNAVSNTLAAITDATTDVNMGSKFFFDKSEVAIGVGNTVPAANSITFGNPANVIIRYAEGKPSGNVIIGDPTGVTRFDLDVRGNANVDAIIAVSSINIPYATTSRALRVNGAGNIVHSPVTDTELGFLDGVTSSIQTQINATLNNTSPTIALISNVTPQSNTVSIGNPANIILVANTIHGGAGNVIVGDPTGITSFNLDVRGTANVGVLTSTGVTDSSLTASRVLQTDASKGLESSAVTTTELGFVSGVTSAIQTQVTGLETRRSANMVSPSFTTVAITDDLTITGNLVVLGDTTTTNTESLVIQDNMIMLANGTSGTSTLDVGLLLNRGSAGNAFVGYDESNVAFVMVETKDKVTNSVISPTSYANLVVGNVVTNFSRSTKSTTSNLVVGSTNETTGFNLDVRGTANVGSLAVDSLTIDGTEIDATGDITIDSGGQINLDGTDGETIDILKEGVRYMSLGTTNSSTNGFVLMPGTNQNFDIRGKTVVGLSSATYTLASFN